MKTNLTKYLGWTCLAAQMCPSQVLQFKLSPPPFELTMNKTANKASLHTAYKVREASLQPFVFVPCFEQFKWKLRFGWTTKSPSQPILFPPQLSVTCSFKKNSLTHPLKGTAVSAIKVCRELLQDWRSTLMGKAAWHQSFCLPGLHESHRKPGLLELITQEKGQRARAEQEQQWSQLSRQTLPIP